MAEETIESLRAQIASLARENARLVSENTRRKMSNRELTSKLTTATADLTQATRDRDTFKTKAEKNPGPDSEEIETLKSQVRSYRHKDGLSELAYSQDVGLSKSVPIDRLMKLIDYKPISEEFDAKAVKKLLIDLKETDPYLFGDQAGGNGQQKGNGAPLNPAVAGLGSAFGRGAAPGPGEPQALSEEQLRNPVFMSEYHAKQRQAASK